MGDSPVPRRLDKLDMQIAASTKLYNELRSVLNRSRGHPNLSTFMVLGCLEALKTHYYNVNCSPNADDDEDS